MDNYISLILLSCINIQNMKKKSPENVQNHSCAVCVKIFFPDSVQDCRYIKMPCVDTKKDIECCVTSMEYLKE